MLLTFSNPAVQAVFDANKVTKAEFSALMRDTTKGTQKVSYEEANAKIVGMFRQVCGVDEKSSRKDIRNAIRRHYIDIYEVVEEVIPDMLQSGWDANPFFREFVEERNLAEGDSNIFYTAQNVVLNVSRVSGGHWDIKRQRLAEGSRFAVETEAYAIAVYAEFERLMAGLDDWATLVAKVAEAFAKKVNDALYLATIDAVNKIPNKSQFNKTLDFSAVDDSRTALVGLVDDVQTATGLEAVIMGTKGALSKLRKLDDVSWVSNEMKQERYTTGKLGYFEGIRLAEIPQVFKQGTTQRMIDADSKQLLVMPVGDNKFLKLVNEGEGRVKEVNDGTTNADMSSEYMYIQKFGIASIFGYQFGAVTIA